MSCQYDNPEGCTKKENTCCIVCASRNENDCGISYYCDSFDSVEYAEDCDDYVNDEGEKHEC